MKHLPAILAVSALAACSDSVSLRPETCQDTRTCDTGVAPEDAVADSSGADRPDGAVTDAGARDAAPDRLIVDGGPPGEARTYDYVITGLTIEPNEDPSTAARGFAGFDLDGRQSRAGMFKSADCAHADFFSTLDPDQNAGTCAPGLARGGTACMGGVDNQLPVITSTVDQFSGMDIRDNIRGLLANGAVSILVRVENVNGVPGPGFNDPEVDVLLYSVAHPMFASCSDIGTPGRAYAVDNSSLTTPGDLRSARARFRGVIYNGRLRVEPPAASTTPNFSLPLPLGGTMVAVDLFRTQLRFDMTPDRGANGNLGGYARLSTLVTLLQDFVTVDRSLLVLLLQGFVDVQDPAGDAMGCGQRRDANGLPTTGGIGMGMGFNTVRAVIEPMTVSGPVAGMCGGS